MVGNIVKFGDETECETITNYQADGRGFEKDCPKADLSGFG